MALPNWIQTQRHILFLGFIFVGFAVLSLSATHYYLNDVKHSLPCLSAICGKLNTDPLRSVLGIPVSILACFAIFAILTLGLKHSVTGLNKIESQIWQLLNAGTSIWSGVYVAYVRLKYGGFCPWCSCIAVGFFSVAWCSLWLTPKIFNAPKNVIWNSVAAVVASIVLTQFFVHSQVGYPANPKKIRSIGGSRFFQKSHKVSEASVRDRATYALFIDFECNTCRTLLKKMLSRDADLYLFTSAKRSAYHEEAYKLLLGIRDVRKRSQFLRLLLEDESFDVHRLQKARDRVGEFPVVRITPNDFDRDVLLSQEIDQKMTPAVIREDREGVTLLPSIEVEKW